MIINPYISILACLALTVYGQIIIKHRINLKEALAGSILDKISTIIYYFFDPYIFSGLIAAFIASIFWMFALTSLPLTRAYPVMSSAPLIVLLFGILFLDESLTIGKVLGGLLILIGVYLSVKM